MVKTIFVNICWYLISRDEELLVNDDDDDDDFNIDDDDVKTLKNPALEELSPGTLVIELDFRGIYSKSIKDR